MSDLTLLAPESVAGWFEPLGGDPAAMMVIGERGPLSEAVVERIRAVAGEGTVTVYSGHDSLVRDHRLAELLRAQGMAVRAQSATAVHAGRDKVVARELLRDAGVPLTPWGTGPTPDHEGILVKSRDSTQSRSIRWAVGGEEIASGDYWERWSEGAEHSVVGYREDRVLTLLPIVSKGRTRRDLLPPWRRLRWVLPDAEAPFAEQMYAAARTTAEALDIWGFFEVEFVTSDEATVIEVNPRISGTLRLAAMAADVKVFARHVFDGATGVLPAVLAGVEVPFDGLPVVDDRLIATSRLTCVGESLPDVIRRMTERDPGIAAMMAGLPVRAEA